MTDRNELVRTEPCSENRQTQMRSTASGPPIKRLSLAPSAVSKTEALQRLCSMKRNVEFTPHQLETWLASLAHFEDPVVQTAVLKLGLSTDPFPDLGKLVIKCQELSRSNRDPLGTNYGRPRISTLAAVARAFGWHIRGVLSPNVTSESKSPDAQMSPPR